MEEKTGVRKDGLATTMSTSATAVCFQLFSENCCGAQVRASAFQRWTPFTHSRSHLCLSLRHKISASKIFKKKIKMSLLKCLVRVTELTAENNKCLIKLYLKMRGGLYDSSAFLLL